MAFRRSQPRPARLTRRTVHARGSTSRVQLGPRLRRDATSLHTAGCSSRRAALARAVAAGGASPTHLLLSARTWRDAGSPGRVPRALSTTLRRPGAPAGTRACAMGHPAILVRDRNAGRRAGSGAVGGWCSSMPWESQPLDGRPCGQRAARLAPADRRSSTTSTSRRSKRRPRCSKCMVAAIYRWFADPELASMFSPPRARVDRCRNRCQTSCCGYTGVQFSVAFGCRQSSCMISRSPPGLTGRETAGAIEAQSLTFLARATCRSGVAAALLGAVDASFRNNPEELVRHEAHSFDLGSDRRRGDTCRVGSAHPDRVHNRGETSPGYPSAALAPNIDDPAFPPAAQSRSTNSASRQKIAQGASGTYIGDVLFEHESSIARWPTVSTSHANLVDPAPRSTAGIPSSSARCERRSRLGRDPSRCDSSSSATRPRGSRIGWLDRFRQRSAARHDGSRLSLVDRRWRHHDRVHHNSGPRLSTTHPRHALHEWGICSARPLRDPSNTLPRACA